MMVRSLVLGMSFALFFACGDTQKETSLNASSEDIVVTRTGFEWSSKKDVLDLF